MAEIRVTSAELKNKAAELRGLNDKFQAAIEELTANEQQLMGMWDGDSKEAFHAAYNNDKTQMDNFYAAIEKFCQVLEMNAAQYENAEAKNTNTASTRSYK